MLFFIDNDSARDNLLGAFSKIASSSRLNWSLGNPTSFHQYRPGSRVSKVSLTLETTLLGSSSHEWQESGRKQSGWTPPLFAGGSIASWRRQSEQIVPWQTELSVKHD
jgi:hypothetical protein